ncbi:unnamed protein product, partial [Laminaria digitata]
MMGTVGCMPLECMLGSVATSASQDGFALASMAFVVCASPDKAQCNMFAHGDLYTGEEQKRRAVLEAESATRDVSAQIKEFE